MQASPDSDSDRSVSPVIGVVLLLAIIIGSISVMLVLAEEEFNDARSQIQSEQAALAMSSLDGDASLVALGQSQSRRVPLGRSGQVTVDDETGQLSIILIYDNGSRTVVANATLGSIRQQTGDTALVYQGGGVWRYQNGRTQMVSPPEFHYRKQTLTFPIITVEGSYAGSGGSIMLQGGKTELLYPNETYSNPLSGGVIRVEATSPYHGGWAQYFETRTEGAVEHDPANNRAAVNLTAPIGTVFGNSITATDSGPGAISPSPCVTGGGGPGFECPTATGQQLPSASPKVDDKISACQGGGCKDLSTEIADGTLESGTYYHNGDFQFGPSMTTLDTTSGNISIVVDGKVTFKGSGGPGTTDVEILGDQGVTYYVKDGLESDGNAAVNTGGDPSDLLVLVHSDADNAFNGGTPQFTGMVYAPNSNFTINGGGAVSNNVFGAVVAQTGTINGNGYVKYDDSLSPVMDISFNPELTYLHVSRNQINVSSG